MNISPWTIYLILQLDAIRDMFTLVAIIASVIGGVMTAVFCIAQMDGSPDSEILALIRRYAGRPITTAVVLWFTIAILPTTRTMAAMVIVPAIVNNQAVQHEAGDLYKLAKEALQNAVTPPKKDQ